MKKIIKFMMVSIVFVGVFYSCHQYGQDKLDDARQAREAAKKERKEALVDVDVERYQNSEGKEFVRIHYSQGEVNIPDEYLSMFRISPMHAVQFMSLYWPSRNPLKEPLNDGVQKKVRFFFLFDVKGGRFNNSRNLIEGVRELIDNGRLLPAPDQTVDGVTRYFQDDRTKGGVYVIDSSVVLDPLGREIAYSCSSLSDRCFFTWVFNDGLYLRVEFNGSDVDDKVELIKELSKLISNFIQE